MHTASHASDLPFQSRIDPRDHTDGLCRICLRNLYTLRLATLAGQAVAYATVVLVLGLPLPVTALLGLGVGLLAYTCAGLWRLRAAPAVTEWAILGEVFLDIAVLAAALYLTGGTNNPLSDLLLLPVIVAAATLRPGLSWGPVAAAVACYTLLRIFHDPFPIPHHGPEGFELHLVGMWYGFLLIAILITFFVAKIGAALRAHDLALVEAQKQALVENSPMGVFVVRQGKLVFVNPTLADLLEYERHELIGIEAMSLVGEAYRERVAKITEPNATCSVLDGGCECQLLSKSGQPRWVTLHRTSIRYRGVPAILGNVQDIGQRKRMELELHALSARLLNIQEDERRRVARELHDSIGQTLTGIKFTVEAALGTSQLEERRVGMERLRSLVPTIQAAVEEVRRISTGLRPSSLDDLGLLATVAWHLREFEKIHTRVAVEPEIDVKESDIPEELRAPIFRILQEATNNVANHSGATHLVVGLDIVSRTLRLRVQDDGVGFDREARRRQAGNGGSGVSSMRERAELSGGTFLLNSTLGAGTTVLAEWRLAPSP